MGAQAEAMDADRRAVLEFAAAQLAFVVGLLHLGMGLVNWTRYLGAGFYVPPDARWPAFVASGIVVLAGIVLARRADDRRPSYAAGVVAMLGYAVGYFGWHLAGHRPLLVLGPAAAAESVTLRWFLDHLFAGPLETVAVLAEVLAALLLLGLLLGD